MPQSRKWQLTFNNPAEHGFTHDAIIAAIENLASVAYWCMCDEVGSEGTLHTHLYICFQNPKAHTVIANAFPGAHRENVKGTSQQNRDYVLKDGEKYNKQPDGTYDYIDGSGKRHQGTNYTDTFEEWGEMPQEHQGKSKDVEKILALLKDGADNLEIVDQVPSAMLNIDKVERTRSMYRDKQFAETWRDLEATYIFGATGAGKTRSVMDQYGYRNCYRVTDYRHPFDTYDGQAARIPPRPSEPFVDKGFSLHSALFLSAILGFVEFRLHRILYHAAPPSVTKYKSIPADYRLSIDRECSRFKHTYSCLLSRISRLRQKPFCGNIAKKSLTVHRQHQYGK